MKNKISNTVYVARDKLTWDKSKPGAGMFNFDKSLVLTKTGFSRSKWKLPDFFRKINISWHSEKSWEKEYFQSAHRGQEFVVEENKKVENWAQKVILGNLNKPN